MNDTQPSLADIEAAQMSPRKIMGGAAAQPSPTSGGSTPKPQQGDSGVPAGFDLSAPESETMGE